MDSFNGLDKGGFKEKYGKYVPILAFFLLFSIVLYSQLWANSLVNQYDGLWNGDYYKDWRWELSIGRWFWPYLDRLRLCVSPDPAMTIVTLCCFSIGVIVVLDLLGTGSGWRPYIAGALFLSSTAVCVSLSYRYMSPTFGVSFMLSTMAAWVLARIHNPFLSIVLGGILLALSMGLYQANIGCTAIALLGYFIIELNRENSQVKDVVVKLLRCGTGIGGGGYYILRC